MLANRFGTKTDNLTGLTLQGVEIETPPASLEEARRESDLLISKIQDIDAQLGDKRMIHTLGTIDAYDDWRRRTKSAKQLIVFRLRYLRRWMAQHPSASWTTPSKISAESEIPMAALLRSLAKRAGQLEQVYYAALNHVDQDTKESWDTFLGSVETARDIIGGVPDEIADKMRSAA